MRKKNTFYKVASVSVSAVMLLGTPIQIQAEDTATVIQEIGEEPVESGDKFQKSESENVVKDEFLLEYDFQSEEQFADSSDVTEEVQTENTEDQIPEGDETEEPELEESEDPLPAEESVETENEDAQKQEDNDLSDEQSPEDSTDIGAEAEAAMPRIYLEDGTECQVEQMQTPESLNCQGTEKNVDYAAGVYSVSVPEGTETIQMNMTETVGKTAEQMQNTTFFARWNGYLLETEEYWEICMDLLDEGTSAYSAAKEKAGFTVYDVEYQEGFFLLPLDKFLLQAEDMTVEQRSVYGIEEDQGIYAEICMGEIQPDGSLKEEALLLVSFSDHEDVDLKIEEIEAEPEKISQQELEVLAEKESAIPKAEIAVYTASQKEIETVYTETGNQLVASAKQYIPQISSVNGEWQIIGLARSGKLDQDTKTGYLANVVKKLQDTGGALHKKKYTEYSRVVLALTALGEDVTSVGGYNLLEPLSDFNQTVWQGVNGAIFALVAFDSNQYEIPSTQKGKTQTTRDGLISHILQMQNSDGGWAMSGTVSDPDLTGMALQALAPYCTRSEVKSAVDQAVAFLSSIQLSDGAYKSAGDRNSESCAQVIVGLTALGINPHTDLRFIKNGRSAVDGLLSFAVKGGGFQHVSGSGMDQMATEQGYYALVAYNRFINGKNSLYDMTDVPVKSDHERVEELLKMIKKIPDKVTLDHAELVKKAYAVYSGMSEKQKGMLPAAQKKKLQAAYNKVDSLEIKKVETLISEIGTVTLEKEKKIKEANEAYRSLSESQRKKVGNYKVLQNAIKEINRLKIEGTTPDTENTDKENEKRPGGSTTTIDLSPNKKPYGGRRGGTSTKKSENESKGEEEKNTEKKDHVAKEQEKVSVDTVIEHIEKMFAASSDEKYPENISDFTEKQKKYFYRVWKEYTLLTEKEQLKVKKSSEYSVFDSVTKQFGEQNHYDEESGVDLRENTPEILPGYVSIQVEPETFNEKRIREIQKVLGEDANLISLQKITLMNLFNGQEWEPECLICVKFPGQNLNNDENAVVIHYSDNENVEFLEGKISGSQIEIKAAEFSEYGVVGAAESINELLSKTGKKKTEFWVVGAAMATVLLGALIVLRVIITKKNEDQISGEVTDRKKK